MANIVCIIPVDVKANRLLAVKSSEKAILNPFQTTVQNLDNAEHVAAKFERIHGIKVKSVMRNITMNPEMAEADNYRLSMLVVEVDGEQANSVVQNSQDMVWVDRATYESRSQKLHEVLQMFCGIWFAASGTRSNKTSQSSSGISAMNLS